MKGVFPKLKPGSFSWSCYALQLETNKHHAAMGPQTVREVDFKNHIGSMANGIFTYILLMYMVIVGKYTSPMDP